MPNLTWVKGMESPNKAGRSKGSKRNFKRTVDRFFVLNITLKELRNNYDHLKLGRERIEMIKALLPYHIAPVQANALTESEINALYERLEKTVRDVNDQKKIG